MISHTPPLSVHFVGSTSILEITGPKLISDTKVLSSQFANQTSRPIKCAFTLVAAVFSVISAGMAATPVVELSFGTLPTPQGWSYVASGPHSTDETAHFSATPTSLLQNTTNAGNGIGGARYSFVPTTEVTSGATGFTLHMTASVTQHVIYQQPELRWAAYNTDVTINGRLIRLGILPNEIYHNGLFFSPVGFNGGDMNEYTVAADLVTNDYELFLNGTSIANGNLIVGTGSLVRFGDGTGRADAVGEMTHYSVMTTLVPEPTSILLVGLTSMVFCLRRSRLV